MAYNYYQPMGYTPMYQPQFQQMQGQMPNPQPQIQPQAVQQASILWVDGYNEAAMYPVAPNAAVVLWDKSNPSIYLKRADATGKPSMQIFDLVERKEAPKHSQSDGPQYATQEALEQLSAVVDNLRRKIEEIQDRPTNEGVLKDEH